MFEPPYLVSHKSLFDVADLSLHIKLGFDHRPHHLLQLLNFFHIKWSSIHGEIKPVGVVCLIELRLNYHIPPEIGCRHKAGPLAGDREDLVQGGVEEVGGGMVPHAPQSPF